MEASYNSRCPAVKRLFREAKELHEATEEYYAQPLEDNLFEWHFTVRGPPDTEFDGGIYHGRIIMPADYPMKPPNIIFLTPNGRFETNKKICLSISGHHPETWQPSWSIRTALLAIIGFMPTPANGTIGSLDYTAKERAKLAKKSQEYECPDCGCINSLLKERTGDNKDLQQEAREVMSQCAVSIKADTKNGSDQASGTADSSNTISKTEEADTEHSSLADGEDTTIAAETQGSANPESTVSAPQATNQTTLPGNHLANRNQGATAVDPAPEMLMEGVAPHNAQTNPVSSAPVSSPGFIYNMVLSAAIVLFIGLVMRRIFLLEGDTSEELDDLLL